MKLGIVGLPNVGKSTLFNALTNAGAQAANYAFCTIEPNSAIVEVADARLDTLAKMAKSEQVIRATVEFTDIAGLVKGVLADLRHVVHTVSVHDRVEHEHGGEVVEIGLSHFFSPVCGSRLCCLRPARRVAGSRRPLRCRRS